MLNRISILKDKMLSQPRFVSIEQALIITRTYQENEDKSGRSPDSASNF